MRLRGEVIKVWGKGKSQMGGNLIWDRDKTMEKKDRRREEIKNFRGIFMRATLQGIKEKEKKWGKH